MQKKEELLSFFEHAFPQVSMTPEQFQFFLGSCELQSALKKYSEAIISPQGIEIPYLIDVQKKPLKTMVKDAQISHKAMDIEEENFPSESIREGSTHFTLIYFRDELTTFDIRDKLTEQFLRPADLYELLALAKLTLFQPLLKIVALGSRHFNKRLYYDYPFYFRDLFGENHLKVIEDFEIRKWPADYAFLTVKE